MDAYLTKPLRPEELQRTLNEALARLARLAEPASA